MRSLFKAPRLLPYTISNVFFAISLLTGCGQPDTLGARAPSYPPPSPQQPPVPILSPVTEPTLPVVDYPESNLLNATPQEIAQLALEEVNKIYLVPGGSAEVVYSDYITAQDLPKLGFSTEFVEEPPMVLVIMKGDIDTRALQTSGLGRGKERAEYLGLVYNLRLGMPFTVVPSAKGGQFRAFLNDPTIPEDPTAPIIGPPGQLLTPGPIYLNTQTAGPVATPGPVETLVPIGTSVRP